MRLILGLILATSALLVAPGCNSAAGNLPPPMAPKVSVAKPLVREVRDIDEYTGRIEAVEEVEVRARVSGYLQEVLFKDGDYVEKGQPLYLIDPRTYQAEYDQAKARINLNEARYVYAKSVRARNEKLVQSAAISKEDFDQSVAAEDEALAAKRSAEADTETNRLNLEFTKINAEVSGRIDRTYVTPGNLVQTGTGATLLTKIVSVDPIYVYFNPDELAFLRYTERRLANDGKMEAQHVRERKIEATIILADGTTYSEKGTLDFASNMVDSSTGTIQVRAVFPNAKRALTPGLFVRLQIAAEQAYEAILIPERAINTDQSDKYVYVVDQNNVAQRKNVRLGTKHGRLRAIIQTRDADGKIQGLTADDQVVTSGGLLVRPGDKVEPTVVRIDDQFSDSSPKTTLQPLVSGTPPTTSTEPSAPADASAPNTPANRPTSPATDR